jgi:TrmH family RNA methyltransferase
MKRPLNIKVILVEPSYETNIGYVARVMKNFCLYNLCVVNPKVQIGKETSIFSAHAKDVIRNLKVVNSLQEATKDADIVVGTTARFGKSSRNVLRSPSNLAIIAQRIASSCGKAAIVLGRDTTGLSNEELSLCDVVLTIPTNPEYPTMNISHAAAVILHEVYKVHSKKEPLPATSPDRKAINRLIGLFRELSTRSEMPPHKRKLADRAFRNVISRAFITRRETSLLIGVFRKDLRLIDRYHKQV